jgi:small subunit ribosomal protein S20
MTILPHEGGSLANTKSALKAIRVSERKRQQNSPVRSGVRTALRRARTAIAGGDAAAAQEATVVAQSKLDKAASKGVIHWRNAARRKSRLMRKLAQSGEA